GIRITMSEEQDTKSDAKTGKTLQRVILLVIVIILLASIIIGAFSSYNWDIGMDFDSAEGQVNNHTQDETRYSKVTSDVRKLEGKVNDINSKIDNIAAIMGQLSEIQREIAEKQQVVAGATEENKAPEEKNIY